MRHIDTAIVHCSDTPAERDVTAADIRRWHVEQNEWSDIGYHFVIRRDGTLEEGRPVARAGAHVRGHNDNSIGICLVGGMGPKGKPEFNFTYRQMARLLTLLTDLKSQYGLKRIAGHRDFDAGKECPCFNVGAWFNG